MKKVINALLGGLYIFVLMLLAILVFWELYAKKYIDNRLQEYANKAFEIIKIDAKETKNNSELILEMLNIDKNES